MSTGGKPIGSRLMRLYRFERWAFGGLLALILAWGFIGVDRGILEELSGSVSIMQPRFVAVSAVDSGNDALLASRGEVVFDANGCYACHTVDGSDKIGPSLLGVWGTEQRLADGTVAVVDEPYFRESILYPEAKVVVGFDNAAMPSYKGLVTEDDLEALAAYLRSLR